MICINQNCGSIGVLAVGKGNTFGFFDDDSKPETPNNKEEFRQWKPGELQKRSNGSGFFFSASFRKEGGQNSLYKKRFRLKLNKRLKINSIVPTRVRSCLKISKDHLR
jgi:hypothetical protein